MGAELHENQQASGSFFKIQMFFFLLNVGINQTFTDVFQIIHIADVYMMLMLVTFRARSVKHKHKQQKRDGMKQKERE